MYLLEAPLLPGSVGAPVYLRAGSVDSISKGTRTLSHPLVGIVVSTVRSKLHDGAFGVVAAIPPSLVDPKKAKPSSSLRAPLEVRGALSLAGSLTHAACAVARSGLRGWSRHVDDGHILVLSFCAEKHSKSWGWLRCCKGLTAQNWSPLRTF